MVLTDLNVLPPLYILLIGMAIGLLFTAVVSIVFFKGKYNALLTLQTAANKHASERLAERESQLGNAQQTIDTLRIELKTTNQTSGDLQARVASLTTELAAERRQTTEKLHVQQQQKEQLKETFENLAQKILDEKSEKFTHQNRQNIDNILSPLRQQLGDFKKRVEDVYDKETKDRAQLANEILHLKGLNERISQDAINLTNALKGESKTRGNWGEIVLERILEDAGLREGEEFHREVQLNREEGGHSRPDVVIHMPDKHDLIVDSKVSLTAYEEAMSLAPGEARDAAIKRHVQSLRLHVKSLSEKSYQTLEGINTLDFVLLFVPIEPALHTAFSQAPDIFQEAYEKNIFIVSPTTLLMACRTVQNIWRSDSQSKNAHEISRQAGNMLDKFVNFVDDLDKLGRQIDVAATTYQEAKKKLETGRGNLVGRARKIEQLGAKVQKKLPDGSEDET